MTLPERLARARTHTEERRALFDAIDRVWPNAGCDEWGNACRLLDGPRAGWIGVPLLAMPEDWVWSVKTDYPDLNRGHVYWCGDAKSPPIVATEDANTPACALMLAVLSARKAVP